MLGWIDDYYKSRDEFDSQSDQVAQLITTSFQPVKMLLSLIPMIISRAPTTFMQWLHRGGVGHGLFRKNLKGDSVLPGLLDRTMEDGDLIWISAIT